MGLSKQLYVLRRNKSRKLYRHSGKVAVFEDKMAAKDLRRELNGVDKEGNEKLDSDNWRVSKAS